MADEVDRMVVEVRASTRGFAADMAQMKSAFDADVLGSLGKAGPLLDRSLGSALAKGKAGFDELGRSALAVLARIADRALSLSLDALLGAPGKGSGGAAGGLAALLGGALGLPGRATGGLVSPRTPYLVGERGPELFVPASAGRIDTLPAAEPRRDVRVAISLAAPRGTAAPVALQRSQRQIAAAVRRALAR